MSDQITLVEVGPRDGLQNEKQTIPPDLKIDLINRLSQTGLSIIEAGAFVSPKWVPQMASTDEVMQKITRNPDISYPVLTPNLKGYEKAIDNKADHVAIFAAASQSFSKKNINATIEESLERFKPVLERAKADDVKVRGYVSCVLGCPYEGEIAIKDVIKVAKALYEMGCYEISLGDTIGVGTAGKTNQLMGAITKEIPAGAIAGHFHDTYGQSLANIHASLEHDIRTFDTSVSGLGGCPYAPGASGNVASEDVIYMLEGSGFKTGVNLDLMREISIWISQKLNRIPASKVTLAHQASCAI